MFIYARSEQCDSGPIYTNRIYPGKLKFILVKISPDPGRLHDQTLFTFLTTENLSGVPCSHECKRECIQICPVML